jgi:hypothetical protein
VTAAWTEHVANAGQTSVDPVDGASEVNGQSAQAGEAAGGETILMALPKTTDVTWGGFANMYLTNRRLMADP